MSTAKARVLVIAKRTSFQAFVLDARDPRTLRLLASKSPAVARLRSSHDSHESTLREVEEALARLGCDIDTLTTNGDAAPTSSRATDAFNAADLVVTVGGDGTLLAASHRIGATTPLVGINSAPESSIGFFCAGRRGTAARTLRAALAGRLTVARLARMEVELNGDVVHRRVLNDALFCHASPAATSRYILALLDGKRTSRVEEQRSSGLWIGPAAGSTAAQRSAGGRVLPLASRAMQYVVREPYMRHGVRARMVRGLVRPTQTLEIVCKMRDARIFLDGDRNVHEVGLGDVIRFRRSEETLQVLGLRRR